MMTKKGTREIVNGNATAFHSISQPNFAEIPTDRRVSCVPGGVVNRIRKRVGDGLITPKCDDIPVADAPRVRGKSRASL